MWDGTGWVGTGKLRMCHAGLLDVWIACDVDAACSNNDVIQVQHLHTPCANWRAPRALLVNNMRVEKIGLLV